ELLIDGKRLGWLGEIADEVRQKLDLQESVTVAELDLSVLEDIANFWPPYQPIPDYPAIGRDINFLLDEAISWQEVEDAVPRAAGTLLESVSVVSQYRGQGIPADKKSYMLHVQYRAKDRTLTGDEADQAQQAVVAACTQKLGAVQR